MQHAARDRNAKVGFQVRVMIPHQGCHAIAALHARFLQGFGQSARSPVQFGIGIAVQRMIWPPGDDFGIRKVFTRALQTVRERQGIVHHRSVHAESL